MFLVLYMYISIYIGNLDGAPSWISSVYPSISHNMDSTRLNSFALFAESLATLVALGVSLAGMAQDAAELQLPSVSGWSVYLVKARCWETGRGPLCYRFLGKAWIKQHVKPWRSKVEDRWNDMWFYYGASIYAHIFNMRYMLGNNALIRVLCCFRMHRIP